MLQVLFIDINKKLKSIVEATKSKIETGASIDILDKEMGLSRSEQVELLNNYLNLNDKGISYNEESNTIDVCLDKQLTQEQIYLLKGRYNMQYAMV